MRTIILVILFTLLGAPAWACSCAPSESGYVSEIIEGYEVFWGVPVSAKIVSEKDGRLSYNVKYQIEVLENYNRFVDKEVSVISSIEDGGSCGVQLTIGMPQVMTAWEYKTGEYGVSSCAPSPPYKAVKLFLEENIDTFIPSWSNCHTWKDSGGIERPVIRPERKDCQIWEDTDISSRYYYGYQDLDKYRTIWWSRRDQVD